MKILQFGLVATIALSLCSFAFFSEDGRSQLYKDFLSKFENKTAPAKFTLKAANINNFYLKDSKEDAANAKEKAKEKSKILGKSFNQFIPGISEGMMTRLGPSTYRAEILVANKQKFNAVIYSRSNGWGDDKNFILATFDTEGEHISVQSLGYVYEEKEFDIAINSKLELTIKDMEKIEGKKVLKNTNTRKITISSKGEIAVHDNAKGPITPPTFEKNLNLPDAVPQAAG